MKKQSRRQAAALPNAAVYDAEIESWPWKTLLTECVDRVASIAPKGGTVVDYMCGTGLMLNALRRKRPDLQLHGCDISREYIAHARLGGPGISYHVGNALKWSPPSSVDVIAATAGIHHLKWADQIRFVRKVHSELNPKGWFVVGEETIGKSDGARGREEAVVDFFTLMIPEIMRTNPTPSVIRASLDVFANDLLVRGEFKRDVGSIRQMLARFFKVTEVKRIWPREETGFGDYILTARKTKK